MASCSFCGKKVGTKWWQDYAPELRALALTNGEAITDGVCVGCIQKGKVSVACPVCGGTRPARVSMGGTLKTETACSKACEKELEEQRRREAEELKRKSAECLVTTTGEVAGRRITGYRGVASSVLVQKLNVLQDFIADWGDLFGGRSKGYGKKFDALHAAVQSDMKIKCVEAGGDAIVGAMFDVEFVETGTGRKKIFGGGDILGAAEQIERKLVISGTGTIVSLTEAD